MENKGNSLELSAKENAFLSSMIDSGIYDGKNSMTDRGYRCDPCDACGPSSCTDCKACAANYSL